MAIKKQCPGWRIVMILVYIALSLAVSVMSVNESTTNSPIDSNVVEIVIIEDIPMNDTSKPALSVEPIVNFSNETIDGGSGGIILPGESDLTNSSLVGNTSPTDSPLQDPVVEPAPLQEQQSSSADAPQSPTGDAVTYSASQASNEGVFVASVPEGGERVELGVKFSNHSSVITSTIPGISCSWKPDVVDDGWKSCDAVFEVANHAALAPLITNPDVSFNFLSNTTRNRVILFSSTYTVVNETYLNDTGGNITRVLFPRRRFSNFVTVPSQIDTSKPFAVKIAYEAPKFAENQFNLTISAANFGARIDPNQSSCGSLSSPGVYTLTQSVSYGGTCINIVSNNVTLDCQGYAISYATSAQGYGVVNNGYNGTIVKNCVIQKGSGLNQTNYGIYFTANANGTVYNNTISTNGTNDNYGIFLYSSNTNNVSNNTVATTGSGGNNMGILLSGTSVSNNIVYNNTISTSGSYGNDGISLSPNDAESSKGNNITGNLVRTIGTGTTSGNKGIYLTNADNCIISNNTITTNGSGTANYGIEVSSSNTESISVQYNQVTTNGNSSQNHGLYVNSAHSNSFTGNTFTVNGTSTNYGAWFLAADNNTFSGNTIRTGGTSGNNYGVYLTQGSDYNAFVSNTITTETSASDGVRLSETQNTGIIGNTIETLGATSSGITVTSPAGNYTNISSNRIVTRGSQAKGIALDSSPYNVIYNNTINTTNYTSPGIDIATSFNNITNNTINTSQSGSPGTIVQSSVKNNTFYGNTIYVSGWNSEGIQVKATNNTNITSNTISVTAGSGIGINLSGSSNSAITQNNITTTSETGIKLVNGANLNNIKLNTINSSGANTKGVSLETNTNNNTIESNIITATLMGASLSNDSGAGNLFLNNNFSNANYIIGDESPSTTLNYLIYNNSFGEVRWGNNSFLDNLTFNISNYQGFGLGRNLFIGNNTAALNTSAITLGNINSTANIKLYGLSFGQINRIMRLEAFSNDSSEIITGGTNCAGTSCQIISYNASTGNLLFNTTSFSSFSAANATDVDVSNTSLVYTNSSHYAVLRFFMQNIDTTAHLFNWSFYTGVGTIKSGAETNLTANKTVFVFIENNYSTSGSYIIQANGTTGTSLDSDTANVTVR